MYGNHPYGTVAKRDLKRKRKLKHEWRLTPASEVRTKRVRNHPTT